MIARRCVALLGAGLLAVSVAAPVAAVEPAGVTVHVAVDGYNVGDFGPITGDLVCPGLEQPYGFQLDPGTAGSDFGPFSVPPGNCEIENVGLGDSGYLGTWEGYTIEPEGWFSVADGQQVDVTVTVTRGYNGSEPEPDSSAWVTPSLFTVDRVLVNRSGGITAEGRIFCPDVAEWSPAGLMFVNIDWDALQYIGRRTAVHGSYRSDIATICYDPAHPTAVQSWQTRSGATNGGIWWVYGRDGKFATGTIIIEATTYSTVMLAIRAQWWDETGTAGPYDPACQWEDAQGDGFCVDEVVVAGRVQTPVKATAVRTK